MIITMITKETFYCEAHSDKDLTGKKVCCKIFFQHIAFFIMICTSPQHGTPATEKKERKKEDDFKHMMTCQAKQ